MSNEPVSLINTMFVDLANLLAEAEGSSDTRALLREANALNAKFESWPQSIPQIWHPVRVARHDVQQSIVDAGFYGDYCDTYPDVIVSSTWNECKISGSRKSFA